MESRRHRGTPAREPLSVKALSALDAEAVPAQVVVAAGRADEAARRIRLQPALIFAAVPDAVLRSENPAAPLAVEDGKVPDRHPERSGQDAPGVPLFDERSIADLGFGERIDCHAESIARSAWRNWVLGGAV